MTGTRIVDVPFAEGCETGSEKESIDVVGELLSEIFYLLLLAPWNLPHRQ